MCDCPDCPGDFDEKDLCECGHARYYHRGNAHRCRANSCHCEEFKKPGEECQIAHAATNGAYRCKSKAGHEGPCPAEPTNLYLCEHSHAPCAICWADTDRLEALLDAVSTELVRRGRYTIPSNHKLEKPVGPPNRTIRDELL